MTSAGHICGYARVSTADRDLSIQNAALRAAGCTIIRAEKVTGTSREGRTELALLLALLRKGDTLVVTRIDAWRAPSATGAGEEGARANSFVLPQSLTSQLDEGSYA